MRGGALRADRAAGRREYLSLPHVSESGRRAFMAFAGVPLEALTWTRGAPKIFVSLAIAERGFCAECGTPLTYRPFAHQRIAVTIGSLDDPASVAPKRQFGVESKLPWIEAALTLPGIKTSEWQKLDEAALASRQHPDREI